jgi:hypothetical protein
MHMLGSKYVAILALLVVGVILVVQMAQGEANTLHWFGLGAIVIGLVAVAFDIQKARQE